MTMEYRDPKYFRRLLVERKDPAGNPRGPGDGLTQGSTNAGGPDESPRVPMRPLTREEIFFLEAWL